ncbi:MAG: hypothetical protein ACI4JI_10580 [Ruminiclostridium sp.]
MKKKALMLTTALITTVLFSACSSDNTGGNASSNSGTESKAFSQFTRDNSESDTPESNRTVTEVPSGELSYNDDFLNGIWVDENGFVAYFSENGRITVFDDFNEFDDYIYGETDSDAAASDKVALTITAKDADTITITADGTSYTAYHADSAKGEELSEKFVESAVGEWGTISYGYEQIYDVGKYNILSTFSNDFSSERITIGLDGVSMRVSLLFDGNIFARLVDDKLKLYSYYEDYTYSFELMKTNSEEYKKLKDAGAAIDGTWIYPDDTGSTLVFANGGTSLKVTGEAYGVIFGDEFGKLSGNTYEISATYENGMINIASDGKTLFYAESYYDDAISIYTDNDYYSPHIEMYREDSETILKAKETEKLIEQKADLLNAYPDDDLWLKSMECGDILSLADKDYIDKYAPSGYFLAGTPQELASFVYYVNTQPIEQGQVSLELTADIDLSGYKWAPMGWTDSFADDDHPFAFCVYGKEHTIKNMTINSDDSNVGFIGWGTVCGVFDLKIEDADVSGNSNVGIITGQAIMGNYENCYASGKVNGSCAGSMLGYEANCSIKDCSADVTVNGEKFDFISWNEKEKSEIVIDDPVTITIDENYTVTRPLVEGYTNLGWMVLKDGEQVLHRNAEDEISYCYFGNEKGHSYKIYLTAYVKGQYVPISNIIEYTVE